MPPPSSSSRRRLPSAAAAPTDPAQRRSAQESDIAAVGRDAAGCRACPLWANATQTVFGEGPSDADVVFVGEQPGDQEDRAGRPFVGPAGQLLDRAMAEAGVDRSRVFVTNAVKHFKFEPRGKRRLHKKPNAGEIQACRWWLTRELDLVRPKLVVALGATAVQSLKGRSLPIGQLRGRFTDLADGARAFVTIHPSYLLRLPDPAARQAEYERFVAELRLVAEQQAA
jgi:uracil-DNA glycosylase family protein